MNTTLQQHDLQQNFKTAAVKRVVRTFNFSPAINRIQHMIRAHYESAWINSDIRHIFFKAGQHFVSHSIMLNFLVRSMPYTEINHFCWVVFWVFFSQFQQKLNCNSFVVCFFLFFWTKLRAIWVELGEIWVVHRVIMIGTAWSRVPGFCEQRAEILTALLTAMEWKFFKTRNLCQTCQTQGVLAGAWQWKRPKNGPLRNPRS